MKNNPLDIFKKIVQATGISQEESDKITDLLYAQIESDSYREILNSIPTDQAKKFSERLKGGEDRIIILNEIKHLVGETKINEIIRKNSMSVFNNNLITFYHACKPEQKQEIDRLLEDFKRSFTITP